MADPFQNDAFDEPPPDISWDAPPLPRWLARRLLRPDEHISWVRGPRRNPFWEPYVTHPLLFLVALALAVGCVWAGRVMVKTWSEIPPALVVTAGGLVLGSIYVLAIANAFFTRLVVTNQRIVILQGYEVRRQWNINDLPPSLVRYRKGAGGKATRSVNLAALETMLGSSSQEFAESKTILALGKQIDQIKVLRKDRPDAPQA
jgi:hypothetical protein